MALTKRQLSKLNSECRTRGHERRRKLHGLPEPTAYEKKLRKLRNLRYQANKKLKQQQAAQQQAA